MNLGDTIYAWVTETPDGSVSLIGASLAGLGHMALIGRSEEAVRKFEAIARTHGDTLHQPVWMRRYKLVEEIGRPS